MLIYWQIFLYNSKIYFTQISSVIIFIIRRLIELIFLLYFWSLIKDQTKTFNELISYFLIAGGISELVLGYRFDLGNYFKKQIRDGKFSQIMIKPLNIIPTMYATFIGTKMMTFVFSFLSLFVGIILNPNFSLLSLLLLPLFTIISFFIALSINLFLASIALGFSYVLADVLVDPLNFSSRLLSGALIPFYFISEPLRSLISHMPFAYIVSSPTLLITEKLNFENLLNNFFYGSIWAVSLFTLAIFIFNKSLKKYEAVGI